MAAANSSGRALLGSRGAVETPSTRGPDAAHACGGGHWVAGNAPPRPRPPAERWCAAAEWQLISVTFVAHLRRLGSGVGLERVYPQLEGASDWGVAVIPGSSKADLWGGGGRKGEQTQAQNHLSPFFAHNMDALWKHILCGKEEEGNLAVDLSRGAGSGLHGSHPCPGV